jgi:hypothetical protein
MENDLQSTVEIRLPKSVCLVLFELLTRSYERWRESNPDDSSAGPMLVNATEQSDRMALWQLEGALERTLPELFSSDYEALLLEAGRLIAAGQG